jgi:hypothetical protein
MFESMAAHVIMFCRDCGRPMHIMQQEELDGTHFFLVTCWEPTCLLRGFTLSLDRYKCLDETQLEVYRDMNRFGRLEYVRVDGN